MIFALLGLYYCGIAATVYVVTRTNLVVNNQESEDDETTPTERDE